MGLSLNTRIVVVKGEEVFLGDPEKIREKEEAMLRAREKGEVRKRMSAKRR